ncbi:S8 family peptidase [Phytohabitans houttuyneae]|uniref:Peptidase n=1 Tax=Phytohabitans houttuyneae TaxID=1076126 RepID=A0A6V8KB47_9ACTN|nr:S8 family serine peptidase [Phytohabitans houttuyneae]GFJ82462.1 peptidase [Phytohabitans houttuyneae]
MRRRAYVAGVLSAVLAAAGAVVAVAPAGHAGSTSYGRSGPGGAWVTLVTGDRVLVPAAGGRADVRVEPAPRARAAQFQQFTRRGDRYVLPSDAAAAVRAGTLDWQLFNVTGLVRQGFDDARVASLPLLVEYTDGAAARRAAPDGVAVRRSLPGVRMAALDAGKAGVGGVWRDLSGGGVRRVWLNARAAATLDESVARIGAPAAWQRGLTGKGVRVAVLDTGVDTDHPDLAGKVAVSRDFSGKGSVEDGNGHGTHVASTVAGSGAASGGRYRGVAPDATLAVGKVLDDDGNGSFDAIIAGMQWAAAEAGADVVNMSLGGYGSDGTDPLSVAVGALTRAHGTLFVAAAGNDGADEWVSTPAVATEALAVGSVSKADVRSDFSNRGPRPGDGAVKPDLAAPGEGIVAAAPAGVPPLGEPVGEAYQRVDGTSMAAPHVAGSAALLAQLHPQWTPAELKDGLMSTAVEVAGAGPYAVGTGRVDAGRATGQAVTATGSLSTYLRWPNQGAARTQAITWRNTGASPVTLALSGALTRRDGEPAPEGMLALSAHSVTVPAGGTATVDVTMSAVDGAPGTYGGVIEATGAAVATRTAVSVSQEDRMFDLTVALLDRDGRAPREGDYPSVTIYNLDDSDFFYWGLSGTVRLPAGRYAVHTTIETPRAGQEPEYSFISHPELHLDRDVAQTFDARLGQPVSVTVDNPAARGGDHYVQVMSRIADCACTFGIQSGLDPRFHPAYAATVPGTSSTTFAFGQSRRATAPELELFADDGQSFEVATGWLSGSPTPRESATLPVVFGGQGTPEDLAKVDAKGKLVLFELSGDTSYEEVYRRTGYIRDAGARMAMVNVLEETAPAALARRADEEPAPALPTLRGFGPTAARLAALAKAGGATVRYASRPMPEHRYELAYGVLGQVTGAQVHRPRTRDLAAVRTAYHDNVADSVRYVAARVDFFGTSLGGGWSMPVRAPQERVEYFSPGTWHLDAHGYWGPRDSLDDTLELAAGRTYRLAWNKAVAGPTFAGATATREDGARPWAWRDGGAIDVVLPLYGDGAGRPRVPFGEDGTDTGSISLYRDGTLVSTAPVPDRARFEVPAGPARYRLVAHTERSVDWWPQWTSVTAAWTFRSSAAGEGEKLPLLAARFAPAVDLRNRAPGGRSFTIPVYVERQDTERVSVRRLTVDVSYDDGRTWHEATVRRSGPRWTATVHHPAGGHAALRASVTDADGNTVVQTVLRAYAIGS